MAEKMTRRAFIKGTAAVAAAVSMSGILAGCGGGQAQDEVKLGAYSVKLYSANTRAEEYGTGSSSYKITAKADITFNKNAGSTFQELSCAGMFTGKIDTVSLNTANRPASSR